MNTLITEIQIRAELERQCGHLVNFAYLLGSAGTERFHAESDIDLAVHWKTIPQFSDILKITRELSNVFNREVDFVSLNTTDLIFSRQILETGRLLFCSSPGVLLNWKVDQLSRYPDFKYTRAPIEKNILNRKRYV